VTVLPTRRAIRFGAPRRSHPSIGDHAQLAGRTHVASFARYPDAERTVDLLARTHFPVHRLALVGGDLKLVTESGGGITSTRAGSLGACGGLWIGALMVLFAFVVDRPTLGEMLVLMCWGVPLGALFGGALGLASYTILGSGRDLTSRRRLVAARHELHVDAEVATSAWRLLLKLHPAGMSLVDRVPAEVVPLPTELVLIETFEPAEPAEPATEPPVRPEPRQSAQPPLRPVELPAG
jgi:hypothetical protein